MLFNISLVELIFILLIVFIFIGTDDTVKIAKKMGLWLNKLIHSNFWREMRETATYIRTLPRMIMKEAEMEESVREIKEEIDTISTDLDKDIQGSIPQKPLAKSRQPIEQGSLTKKPVMQRKLQNSKTAEGKSVAGSKKTKEKIPKQKESVSRTTAGKKAVAAGKKSVGSDTPDKKITSKVVSDKNAISDEPVKKRTVKKANTTKTK